MRFAPSRALVTGASSGIGAAFAHALAARGTDLVLVARREARLQALATELRERHRIAALPLALDLAAAGAIGVLHDRSADGSPIEALINCAGFGTHGPFAEEDAGRIDEEVRINVGATVALCHAFLPPMLARGRGAIVNVASLFAYQPAPDMAVYAATKAFVLHFSEALWHETRKTGVRVLAVSPGPTRTEFFDTLDSFGEVPALVFQTPEQVVATALRALERRNPPPSVTSGALANALARASRLVPRRAAIGIGARFT